MKKKFKNLSPRKAKLLGNLLDEVAAIVRKKVEHPIPKEAFEPLHRVVPYPAIDIVILDKRGRLLMVYRDDKYFKGWELVGGYGHWYEKTLAEWCNRLTMRDIGAHVKLLGFTGIHKWKPGEHAHGAPISIVALCKLAGRPKKNLECIKFFKKAPKDMVPNHGNFVRATVRAIRTGKIIPEI